ncbi:MAG: response regulator [Saprospiraceae bacterium]|nr:response regulator [Saprospiraceae bacterium]
MTEREFLLEKRLKREITARKAAEKLLESKSLELYHVNVNLENANKELLLLNKNLEQQVKDRSEAIIVNELKYKTLIDNMDLGLMEVDSEHNILNVNKSFERMVGYSKEELLYQNAMEVFAVQEDRSQLEAENMERLTGLSNMYEARIRHKDGRILDVLISGTPVTAYKGKVIGSIGIHYDITPLKELQRNLVLAREEAVKSQHLAEKAKQAEQKFLANMSHEMRTPLNAIIGMSHLELDTLNFKQKEFISVLRSSADMLLRLISDVLDFSKIESGNLEAQNRAFDLNKILKLIQRTYSIRLEGSPVEFRLRLDQEINTMMFGDDLLLSQIFNNLLSNAEKFTGKGFIELYIERFKKEENHIWYRFKFTDTGIGIDPDSQKVIFESYRQAKSDIRIRYGGTGLGLPITKKIVQFLGGNLTLQSKVGEGTIFTIELPLKDTGRPIEDTNKNSTFQKTKIGFFGTILVVEDNAINRKYAGTLLAKWEMDYEFAYHGADAVRKANEKHYSLILMDLQMPQMNGYEATQAIRSQSIKNADTPIIALTATAIQAEREKAKACGMNDFLSKPFTPSQLAILLNRYQSDININVVKKQNPDTFTQTLKPDIVILRSIYGEDYSYLREMFTLFLSESEKMFPQLEKAVVSMNFEEIKRTAHRVKPSFGLVGFPKFSDDMTVLESAAMEKNAEAVIEIYDKFKQFQSHLLSSVHEVLENIDKGNILTV